MFFVLGVIASPSEPCYSVSHVDSCYSSTSSKSLVVKRIELQKKRAELQNIQELAKAKVRKTRKLAEAETDEAEALVKRTCQSKSS